MFNGGHPGSMGRKSKCFYKGPPGEVLKQTEILALVYRSLCCSRKVLQICAEKMDRENPKFKRNKRSGWVRLEGSSH